MVEDLILNSLVHTIFNQATSSFSTTDQRPGEMTKIGRKTIVLQTLSEGPMQSGNLVFAFQCNSITGSPPSILVQIWEIFEIKISDKYGTSEITLRKIWDIYTILYDFNKGKNQQMAILINSNGRDHMIVLKIRFISSINTRISLHYE